jgi:hypothetical protein
MGECDSVLGPLDAKRAAWAASARQVCADQRDLGYQKCTDEEDMGHSECTQKRDDGYNACTQRRDDGYRNCCTWWPCSWLCQAWTWVSNIVCVAWTWISNLVCVAWTWIKNLVCKASVWVSNLVCVAWVWVLDNLAKVGIWAAGILCDLVEKARELILYHLCGSTPASSVPSVPRISASANSIAAVPSRFSYNDSGAHYEFKIDEGSAFFSTDNGATWQLIAEQMISYDDMRVGDRAPAPKFDIIAANGGRVFAKEVGFDRFYFAILDQMFWQYETSPGDGIDSAPAVTRTFEKAVPSTYFKLDPERNEPGEQIEDLLRPLEGEYHDHPAAERFDLFSVPLASGLVDFMVVAVEPRLWHRIDTRPPKGAGKVPAGLPASLNTTYCNNLGQKETACSITFDRVLDIGVGHAHWHEQYVHNYGGEIQPLFTIQKFTFGFPPAIWTIDVDFISHAYQFFNGPIVDGDGFIDGTCNFYVLCHLLSAGPGDSPATASACEQLVDKDFGPTRPQEFALIFLDEQSYFSQRWRLAHPDDWDGLQFALARGLHDSPSTYRWNRDTFWDPFKGTCITGQSRLAVSRQIVVVNGADADTGRQELYSANYSWSTSDHSWRWRSLPDGAVTLMLSEDDAMAGTETVVPSADEATRVYPQTVRLREDTTLHVKGTQLRADGTIQVGRWFQKYLPANCEMSPAASALVAASPPSKPATGYMHPWEFLPEPTFARVDAFSHFGVYETVDSRGQYYLVDLDETMLPEGMSEDWRWDDLSGQLTIFADKFNWEFLAKGQSPIVAQRFQSIFTPGRIMLKLVKRAPLGWIAMHWDKRDDDLCAFDMLPQTVQLTHGDSSLEVKVKSQVQIWRWPEVQDAVVTIRRERKQIKAATVSFRSNQPEPALGDNIWRVKIAAVPADGGVVVLFDRERSGNFVRRDPSDFWYDCEWTITDELERALIEQFCTEEGRLTHGSSIWFEDAVGHVSTGERTRFVLDTAGG